MKKHSAFTLIELLIVVAIIAILAAIAVPNFLEAQVRSKVSRVQSDLRSLATALESYRVDQNSYPMATQCGGVYYQKTRDTNYNLLGAVVPGYGGSCTNVNYSLIMAYGKHDGATWRVSFGIDPGLMTLTTPTAYLTSYPADPFADTLGLTYGYANAMNKGWMLWSFGPDADQDRVYGGSAWAGGGQIANFSGISSVYYPTGSIDNYKVNNSCDGANSWILNTRCGEIYNPDLSNPSATLLVGGFTYDSSNGTRSRGDVWRVKQ